MQKFKYLIMKTLSIIAFLVFLFFVLVCIYFASDMNNDILVTGIFCFITSIFLVINTGFRILSCKFNPNNINSNNLSNSDNMSKGTKKIIIQNSLILILFLVVTLSINAFNLKKSETSRGTKEIDSSSLGKEIKDEKDTKDELNVLNSKNNNDNSNLDNEIDNKKIKTDINNASFKKEVYNYFDNLLTSKDNPSNWSNEKIGFNKYEFGTDEYNQILVDWKQQCSDYEDEAAKKTAEKFNITVDEVNNIYFEMIFGSTSPDIDIRFGDLLETNVSGTTIVIKTKISSKLSNKLTIDQNYYNVEDFILNQGGNEYDEIQYWAVADMMDGSESKVISFTLNKDLINYIYNGKIVANQFGKYLDDLWILPSLLE